MHDCEMPKKSTLNTERMSNKTILDAMAYLENFNGGFFISGLWWSFVFCVLCL